MVHRSAATRPTGVAAIPHVAWGDHICQLYRSRQDLIDSLVPFFAAGLAHGERCIWIASEPLRARDARAALAAVVPDLAAREARGQLEVLDHDAWYTRDGATPDEVINGWLDREQAALRAGYAGLRLNGNTSWLPSTQWDGFAAYEARVHRAFHGRKIVALCSYSLDRCGSEQLLDVMQNHGVALVRSGNDWCALHSATAVLAYAGGDPTPQRRGHTVEFYRADAFPVDRVARSLQRSMLMNHAAAALLRTKHLEAVRQQLVSLGVDVSAALDAGALRLIDADAVAVPALDGGQLRLPVVEERVLAPMAASLERYARIVAHGELVDVFVAGGARDAAIQLEQWWNQQVARHPIELHCSYSLAGFADAAAVAPFKAICDAHDAVTGVDDAPRMHAEIAQLSTALATEVSARTALEPMRDHLIALQRVMAQLGEAVTVADVARVVAETARDVLRADRATLFVPELGRWRDPLTEATCTTLPDGAAALHVRGEQVGALLLVTGRKLAITERALVQDVQHQVAHAVDRARAHDEANHANRIKDEFLAMLGHELRNPLAPIVTALQLMNMRGDSHFERERAMIERQVGNLVHLIDELLDVTQISRGKITLERQQVDLADVVATAIEQASDLIGRGAHRIHIDAPPGISLDADPARLAQVLASLVGNAAKFTGHGGEIAIRATATAARVQIEVKDNGIGIEPALLPRVFDMFVQGQQGSDRARGGLGLGLAIAKAIVELHGGTILASSAGTGLGSRFVIELPRSASVRLVSESGTARAELAQLHILVVDDNEDAAFVLAEALKILGHEVTIAHDADAALHAARHRRPDVAILDIGLPRVDGYDLAGAMRTSFGERCPRLVALTGYGQPADRKRSAEAGFAVHLVKPVGIDALDGALRAIAN